MKQLIFAVALAMGAAWLPASAHAEKGNPILRAHNRGAKVRSGRRGFVRVNHRRHHLSAPELDPASSGAALILLLAAAELIRNRRREAREAA